MNRVYGKAARPAAAAIAFCGAVACLILFVSAEPEVANIDPDALLYTLVTVLAVFGVLAPAMLVLLRAAARPTWWGATIFFLALTANAVTLNGRVTELPQTVLSGIAAVLALAMSVVGLVALAEHHASRPPRSRF